jgi:hypothetical protein
MKSVIAAAWQPGRLGWRKLNESAEVIDLWGGLPDRDVQRQ